MYLPLTCGGTLVYADQGTQKVGLPLARLDAPRRSLSRPVNSLFLSQDPFALRDLIERHGVTVLQATPTTYDMLHAIGWLGRCVSEPFPDHFSCVRAFSSSLTALLCLPPVRRSAANAWTAWWAARRSVRACLSSRPTADPCATSTAPPRPPCGRRRSSCPRCARWPAWRYV